MLALREWTLASGATQGGGSRDLASSSRAPAAQAAPHNAAVASRRPAQATAHGDKPTVGRQHFKGALQRVLPSVSREVGRGCHMFRAFWVFLHRSSCFQIEPSAFVPWACMCSHGLLCLQDVVRYKMLQRNLRGARYHIPDQ